MNHLSYYADLSDMGVYKLFLMFILAISVVSAGEFNPEFFANIEYSSSEDISTYVSPRNSILITSELMLLAVFFLSYSIQKEHFDI